MEPISEKPSTVAIAIVVLYQPDLAPWHMVGFVTFKYLCVNNQFMGAILTLERAQGEYELSM